MPRSFSRVARALQPRGLILSVVGASVCAGCSGGRSVASAERNLTTQCTFPLLEVTNKLGVSLTVYWKRSPVDSPLVLGDAGPSKTSRLGPLPRLLPEDRPSFSAYISGPNPRFVGGTNVVYRLVCP